MIYGRLFTANDEVFEGFFKDERLNGEGVLYNEKSRYIGFFHNNLKVKYS